MTSPDTPSSAPASGPRSAFSEASYFGDLDAALAEQLLDGSVDTAHVPPAYQPVWEQLALLRSVSTTPQTSDSQLNQLLHTLKESENRTMPSTGLSTRRITRHAARVAVVATAAVLFTGTAAAAATGALPDNTQHKISLAAAAVGLDIPDTTLDTSGDTTLPDSTTSTSEESATTTDPSTTETTGTTDTTPEPTTTTPEPTTTTSPTTTVVPKPGAETCAAARAVEGAHGCSDVAHQYAPGQQKKAARQATKGVQETSAQRARS